MCTTAAGWCTCPYLQISAGDWGKVFICHTAQKHTYAGFDCFNCTEKLARPLPQFSIHTYATNTMSLRSNMHSSRVHTPLPMLPAPTDSGRPPSPSLSIPLPSSVPPACAARAASSAADPMCSSLSSSWGSTLPRPCTPASCALRATFLHTGTCRVGWRVGRHLLAGRLLVLEQHAGSTGNLHCGVPAAQLYQLQSTTMQSRACISSSLHQAWPLHCFIGQTRACSVRHACLAPPKG